MPTLLRQDGFRVLIFLPPREHSPAHVHVVKGGTEVIIRLGSADLSPSIWEIHGMSDRDVLRAFRIVEMNSARLREKWSEYHGKTP